MIIFPQSSRPTRLYFVLTGKDHARTWVLHYTKLERRLLLSLYLVASSLWGLGRAASGPVGTISPVGLIGLELEVRSNT